MPLVKCGSVAGIYLLFVFLVFCNTFVNKLKNSKSRKLFFVLLNELCTVETALFLLKSVFLINIMVSEVNSSTKFR